MRLFGSPSYKLVAYVTLFSFNPKKNHRKKRGQNIYLDVKWSIHQINDQNKKKEADTKKMR